MLDLRAARLRATFMEASLQKKVHMFRSCSAEGTLSLSDLEAL